MSGMGKAMETQMDADARRIERGERSDSGMDEEAKQARRIRTFCSKTASQHTLLYTGTVGPMHCTRAYSRGGARKTCHVIDTKYEARYAH